MVHCISLVAVFLAYYQIIRGFFLHCLVPQCFQQWENWGLWCLWFTCLSQLDSKEPLHTKFGRAKRISCESAGETPNGITYSSTHHRIVLAVRPIIFEVRSSGLILWTHVTISDYVGNILVSNAAEIQNFWANFALWKLVSM